MQFRVRTTDSMPERPDVTRKIEAMKKQQTEDDEKAAAQSSEKKLAHAQR